MASSNPDDKRLRRSGRPRKLSRYGEMLNSQKENKSPKKPKKNPHLYEAGTASSSSSPMSPRSPIVPTSSQDEDSDSDNYVDVESSDHEEGVASDWTGSSSSQESPSKKGKHQSDTDPNQKERERRQREAMNFESLKEAILPGVKGVSHEDTLDYAYDCIVTLTKGCEDREDINDQLAETFKKMQDLRRRLEKCPLKKKE